MAEYLSNYGWHFSKRMCEWAVSMMKDRNGSSVRMKDKNMIEDALRVQGFDVSKAVGYDAVYIEAMARADFYGNSIANDTQLSKFICDYLNDKDGYDGVALTRFYADCMAKGMPIFWEDML